MQGRKVNWLNLKVCTLRRPEYIGAEPTHRAAWLNVLAYCCEQENGGRIVGARNWKCRQWQQTCGVMLTEIDGAAPLLKWEGDDLVVWEFPSEKQMEVQAKRSGGAKGGSSRAKRAAKDTLKDAANHSLNSASSSASTEGERKEKENRNGMPTGSERVRAPVVAKERSGDHRDLIRRWVDEYPKHHDGETYLFQEGKDGSAVSKLLKTSGKTPEELQRMFVTAWSHPTEFNCKSATSISGFLSRFNEIREELNALHPKGNGGQAAPEYLKTEWPAWLEAKGQKVVEYQFAPEFLRSDFQRDRKTKK